MIKESTIENTSELSNWKFTKLSKLCKTGAGGTPLKSHKDYYINGSIPWLRSGEVNNRSITKSELFITEKGLNNSSAKLFPKNSVLVAMYGATAGQVGILRFECSTNQAVCGIFPNDNIIPEFIYYKFLEGKEDLVKQAVGGAQPNISQIKIKNTLIPDISLPQQKQIVSILDKAFAAIDRAKANTEQNLQNAKELFESYLQNVFENNGDDWEEKNLGEVCNKIQDGAHHSPITLYPNREEGLFPYVTSKNVRNNYMDLSKLQFVDETFHNTIYPRCKPEMGDVLLTKDGAKTGNVTLNTLDEPFSLLSSVCLIKTNKNELRADFLKYYIQSPIGFKSITGKMTGAAIKRIILRAIKSATIPLPLVDEQNKIVKNIDSLLAETKKLEAIYAQKIADLEEMKKSVLQKAFSGKLAIDNEILTA